MSDNDPTANPPEGNPAGGTEPPAETPEQTIARLTKEVADARAEAGKSRVNAKAAAAEEARKALAQDVAKALGLVEDAAPDPAKLLEQATAAQADSKAAKLELAVFRAADSTGANASALLDSRTFLAKVAEVDPTDTEALKAAVTEAVAANPLLAKTPPGAGGMKPNPAQGGSANGALPLDAQIAAAKANGDLRGAMRLKAAQAMTTA